jgi:hypothetical protein
VFACGFCHRATGPGGPENADLAGLPKSYIIQQMADYKSGARGTTLPARTPPKLMIELSKPITDAEIEAAAAYFSNGSRCDGHQLAVFEAKLAVMQILTVLRRSIRPRIWPLLAAWTSPFGPLTTSSSESPPGRQEVNPPASCGTSNGRAWAKTASGIGPSGGVAAACRITTLLLPYPSVSRSP